MPSSQGAPSAAVVPPPQTPLVQVSPLVHGFPSSQLPPFGTEVPPAHVPLVHVSPLVHGLPSEHAAPSSGADSPAHVPVSQRSLAVQAFPSSQTLPLSGTTVHDDVPLQLRVLHWSSLHVIVVPAHVPAAVQVSLYVQSLPSLQLSPVFGVTVHVELPLHVRVLHWSSLHVIVVPTHVPPAVQVSLYVQALPSSQLVPVFGVTVHVELPLHVRVLH